MDSLRFGLARTVVVVGVYDGLREVGAALERRALRVVHRLEHGEVECPVEVVGDLEHAWQLGARHGLRIHIARPADRADEGVVRRPLRVVELKDGRREPVVVDRGLPRVREAAAARLDPRAEPERVGLHARDVDLWRWLGGCAGRDVVRVGPVEAGSERHQVGEGDRGQGDEALDAQRVARRERGEGALEVEAVRVPAHDHAVRLLPTHDLARESVLVRVRAGRPRLARVQIREEGANLCTHPQRRKVIEESGR